MCVLKSRKICKTQHKIFILLVFHYVVMNYKTLMRKSKQQHRKILILMVKLNNYTTLYLLPWPCVPIKANQKVLWLLCSVIKSSFRESLKDYQISSAVMINNIQWMIQFNKEIPHSTNNFIILSFSFIFFDIQHSTSNLQHRFNSRPTFKTLYFLP